MPDQTSDALTRFLLPAAGVRGVHVRLQDPWQQVLSHGDYPASVASLLGEATAAAALFTGHVKVDGRLSVQLRGSGDLRTLFAECTAQGTLRGIARWEEGTTPSRDLARLGEDAVLAITIENPGLDPREPQRYQSLVSLQAPSLAEAFEDYFRQSEQLPTRLLLAATEHEAAGLMLQKLPGDEGDEDGWNRAGALFDTLAEPELLDTSAETLLVRLFHEEQVQLLGTRPLAFACSCSRERVAAMLQSLGSEEAHAALQDDTVRVKCEFCGHDYLFGRAGIDELFSAAAVEAPVPSRLH
ncbi:heat-shock protein Hsp33 [Pseudoxanthomonas kalamensis DSM 18571]|uniref:Hsp33 family molecular chaperone HslO n=1 Tax=Pseudoxanthomonas kalamensis TaxID=289483 RepID=UPI001390EFE9|nr:Hsp33 family molecular chaperone HslO [Pseudoxanthomonas kalamensis]KAF1711280.1 heat-shock protein Hsp33 [Pseudoxanthomonas kalamensis DSM 18571]